MRTRTLFCGVAVLLVLSSVSGCSKGPSEEEQKLADLQAQFATIQEHYQALGEARGHLAEAEATRDELEAIPERRRTDEQKAELEGIPALIEQISASRDSVFDQMQGELAVFLNTALNEFPQEPITAEALVIYSDEAILVADEAVAKAGDYKKALSQLDSALSYFEMTGLPPHQPLVDHIAQLEEMRYINQERFDQVEKNMTKDEVKEIAGVPYYQNIKEDPKRGVETWLYRKRDGGAAAIYFRMKTEKVYDKNFDAVKTKVVTDE